MAEFTDVGQAPVAWDKIWTFQFYQGAMPVVIFNQENQALGIEIVKLNEDGSEVHEFLMMKEMDFLLLQKLVFDSVSYFNSIHHTHGEDTDNGSQEG